MKKIYSKKMVIFSFLTTPCKKVFFLSLYALYLTRFLRPKHSIKRRKWMNAIWPKNRSSFFYIFIPFAPIPDITLYSVSYSLSSHLTRKKGSQTPKKWRFLKVYQFWVFQSRNTLFSVMCQVMDVIVHINNWCTLKFT